MNSAIGGAIIVIAMIAIIAAVSTKRQKIKIKTSSNFCYWPKADLSRYRENQLKQIE
jgi:hypothetical protein